MEGRCLSGYDGRCQWRMHLLKEEEEDMAGFKLTMLMVI
jgi:hypothetical protein